MRSSGARGWSAASRGYSPPMDIVPEPIERYAEEHTSAPEPLLAELAKETRETLESIERLEGEFDFVFIDADKVNYVNYYEAVLPRLTERGFIAADNTLWSGRVLDEGSDEEGTRAIRAFNEHVKSDPRVTSVMLTVRDGITLIRPTGGS